MKIFIFLLSALIIFSNFNVKADASLSPFNLSSPAGGITIITSSHNLNTISFVWTKSDIGAKYNFLFKNSLTYSDPPYIKLQSDNSGTDTILTLRVSKLDSLLDTIGLLPGDSIKGVWRVRAYDTTDSLNSNAPDRQITLRRVGLLPFYQGFSTSVFPPPFWYLEYTGTSYWSRELPGAYGGSQGSARFRFRTAPSGTEQTLISNQFPPTFAPNNYMYFNYAYRFYIDTSGALAKDSLSVYISSNNGASWSFLKTFIATGSPALGVNPTSNLTTTGGTGEYLSPLNNEWATKVVVLPIGTNRVKFIAHSSNGNNLFIDDVGHQGTHIISINGSINPEKYSLEQNYPNPFNPSTKINFSIPKQSFVTLKIFDMLGREVTELVNKELSPSNYSIDFNGTNLSSGVYFYKLETPEFTNVKRMMLIK